MGNKKIKAAIYARVSTTEQNPEAQLKELREYVERRGFVLHKEYVDYVTGDFEKRKKSKRKPKDQAYQELMEDAAKRRIDCVIVWKYDRFARSLSVLIDALEHFHKLGVDFISYTQNIDTTTPMGRCFYNVIGSFAEFEKEMIIERVNAGLAAARARGVRLGRPEKDKTAPGRISALREEGWSLRQIAKREKLTAAGVLKILRRIDHTVREADTKLDSPPAAMNVSQSPKILDALMLAPLSNQSTEPLAKSPAIHQLKLAILGIEPQIWRQLLIRGDMNFKKLSDAICSSLSWTGYCQYYFAVMDGSRDAGIRIPSTVESSECFSEFDLSPGEKMLYIYDYGAGDYWTVEIIFEKYVAFDQNLQYPHCAAGELAGPPEKCGGPDAYQRAYYFLSRQKVRGKKASSGKISRLEKEWYRENYRFFDPDHFDRDETNRKLSQRKLRRFRTDE
ncbi:MAG: recombinase family protein [Candidatus Melainabacteria bacterium]|nr:recombinase family protein [Candidatus Melainabacteria bacterium]